MSCSRGETPRGSETGFEREPLRPVARGAEAGSTRLLIVEDNEKMRAVAVKQFTMLGFKVIEADSAERALEILLQQGPVDLLFTDVVLPGAMDGCMLAREVISRSLAAKILLSSGLPGTSLGAAVEIGPGVRLLSKPYRQHELVDVLREIMDEPRRESPESETHSRKRSRRSRSRP
jgi:CheY-like chemotaxis protein